MPAAVKHLDELAGGTDRISVGKTAQALTNAFGVAGPVVSVAEAATRLPEEFESKLLEFFSSGEVLLDNSKARQELDIGHRPMKEGMREYVEWEMEQLGMETQAEQKTPAQ